MLVDRESAGSEHLVVNFFALKPDKAPPAGSHRAPYDELYYVLSGRARLRLGDPPEFFDIVLGTVAFIPGGTIHALENTGTGDLSC